MNIKEEIERYVVEVSELYSLDYQSYFFEFDDQIKGFDGKVQIFDDKKDIDWNIHRISEFLGLSECDVRHVNSKAKYDLWKKYEFFDLYAMYDKCKKQSMYRHEEYDIFSVENIVFTIFDIPLYKKRYDLEDVCKRFVESLRAADKLIPGTYHDGSIPENIQIEVEHFYDFSNIKDLVKSFFNLYDRMSELFFKGLTIDLTQQEINEYNLAVSFFNAQDICGSSHIYYSTLKENRDIYIKEGYSDIHSYVKIPHYIDFKPWKCKQLTEERDLLQKYQNIFPRVKEEIRKFCMNINNFRFTFVWSDELERVRKENERLPDWMIEIGEDVVPEYVSFYVCKTPMELGDDYLFARQLSKMASPASQGGLYLKPLEFDRNNYNEIMKRLQTRYSNRLKSNSPMVEEIYSESYDTKVVENNGL